MLAIVRASGLATVQDLGWETGRAIGLPRSGALDRGALRMANALAGNDGDQAGIEVALAPLAVTFEDDCRFAVTGAVAATVDREAVPGLTALAARAGQRLEMTPNGEARFGYLAVNGGIAVPPTMGQRSTYLPTAIGGHQGRRLLSGDRLPVGEPRPAPAAGAWWSPPPDRSGPIRVVAGPQGYLFSGEAQELFQRSTYSISPTSDRMGTRLTGPAIRPLVAAALPSEPTCLGAIQVPDDGQPIVLLADGPTVGGYPKLAAVITADLDRFAQMGPGQSVRFEMVSLADAELARKESAAALEQWLVTVRVSIRR